MTKSLPGKKGLWGHIKDGLHDLFYTGSRGARITAGTQARNNQNLIEYYDKRDNIQQQMEMAKMQLQVVTQQRSLEVQVEQGNLNRKVQMIEGQLNRQLQSDLAELNRLFQAQEGQLNRQFQAELAVFNQNFQAREGMLNRESQAELARLNRENALQLEIFRGKLQVFLQEQQKEFQLQLKEIDATLAKELKKLDLQNNLTVVRQQRRLNNWPLTLDDEQIKEMMTSDKLMILFVPPILKFDSAGTGSNSTPNNFPEIEEGLKKQVRAFIEKYQQNGRDVDYLTGVWKTKALSAEGAMKTILNTLKPMVIINTIVERSYYHLEYGYATDLLDSPYIGSLPKEESLSWIELLYDATKERLLKWQEQRNLEAEETGTTNDFDQDWGLEVVKKFLADLEFIKREQRLLERGQNPAELPNRNYTILESDKEKFRRFLSIQICILIGKFADEYFILDVAPKKRKPPLLPQLLPDLLKDVPAEYQIEIVEAVIAFSKSLYQQLEKTESAWIPEMLLSLAHSLTFLDHKSYATEQVEESVRCWLLMRGIDSLEQITNLEIMKFVITPEANKYLEYLSQCLDLLPQENLPYAQALYQTWKRLKIRGLLPVDQEGYTLFNR
jgi:hypothetical protein